VTTDQILGIEPAAANKKTKDTRLWRRFSQIEKMPPKEKRANSCSCSIRLLKKINSARFLCRRISGQAWLDRSGSKTKTAVKEKNFNRRQFINLWTSPILS